jgi:hypothetical protein
VREALAASGLLLEADALLPSVTTLVAREPIRGSWWGHPSGNLIYWVLQDLEEQSAMLRAKLLNGKVTLVAPTLWASLAAAGAAREGWQTRALSAAGRSLLTRTRRAGTLRLDQLRRWEFPRKIGDVARELERRLLVHSYEVHTDSGRHAKVLEDWPVLTQRLGLGPLPEPDAARAALERAPGASGARLPWQ